MSALVWCEILRMCIKTLTADDKYSGSNTQSLRQQFQRSLSQKKKDFFWFFIAFLKCALNLEHFQKTEEYPSLIISEIINAERRDYLHV